MSIENVSYSNMFLSFWLKKKPGLKNIFLNFIFHEELEFGLNFAIYCRFLDFADRLRDRLYI
jgi:hypothetical protein